MLLKALPILTLFLVLTQAASLANPFTEPDTSDLNKRDCVLDGCKCNPSMPAGVYCGFVLL